MRYLFPTHNNKILEGNGTFSSLAAWLVGMETGGPWRPVLVFGQSFFLLIVSSTSSVHVSDQQYETGLGQGVDQAGVPPEHPLHEHPETAGADDSWRRINGSVSITRTTCCSPPGTANGDIPTFNPTGLLTIDPLAATDPLKPLPVDVLEPPGNSTPGAPGRTALAWGTGQPVSRPTWHSLRLEELVQELARLDPSMSDTLTSCPSPEPPLGLLDGLIPLAEVWAAMRPAGEEAGKDAAGTPEPG